MNIKKIFIESIKGYQYISKMLPASCRYYPSCSEYATWQFETNRLDKALAQSTLRILRCNQLFVGGIDYPIIKFKPSKSLQKNNYDFQVKYWLFPKEKNLFYIIKDYDFINHLSKL